MGSAPSSMIVCIRRMKQLMPAVMPRNISVMHSAPSKGPVYAVVKVCDYGVLWLGCIIYLLSQQQLLSAISSSAEVNIGRHG